MKVFLDTNVLLSALATRGLCADVLREVLTSHKLVVSAPLLAELKQALRQKLKVPSEFVTEAIKMLQQDAQFSTPIDMPGIQIHDKDDLIIISSALNGNAGLFVTGDKELLGLGKVKQMEIVSPRMFWEKLIVINSKE